MSTDFNLTVDKVITRAIEDAGGKPSNYEEQERAVDHLNLIFSEWSTQGISLFKLELFEVSVSSSVATISLDPSVIRPLSVVINYGSDSSDIPLNYVAYKDYLILPNKEQTGRPNQVLVERLKDNVDLTFWPVPGEDSTLKFWGLKRFDDVTALASTPDVPFRFLPCLRYSLAYSLGIARSDGSAEWENKLNRLEREKTRTWDSATTDDTDSTDLVISPARNI